MNKMIDTVELFGGDNGNRLKVSIPLGMNGQKLIEWKRKNQKEIDTVTSDDEQRAMAA